MFNGFTDNTCGHFIPFSWNTKLLIQCSMFLQTILVAISYISHIFSFLGKYCKTQNIQSSYFIMIFGQYIWSVHEFYHRNFLLCAWCMFVVNSQDPSQTCFLFIKLSWVFLRYHQHIIFSLLIKKTHPLSFNLQSPEGIIKKLSP